MFDALIARTLEGLDHLNTLIMPTARVRFQICPGTGPDLGIADVPYEVLLNGTQFKAANTDANGEATIPVLLFAMGTVVLRIFGTDYNVSFHTLQALNTVAGQQKRFDVMGYFTGYQLVALRNNTIDDDTDTPRLQQAIMNFQTDHVLAMDGIAGPVTRGRMQSEGGE